ncbi:MAG: Fe-S cluster assembly sulfur transfer protein SufU [Gemmatimonadota bacterium]
MSDLAQLYQSVILDHNRNPRNFRALDEANGRADGYNPLCGDKVTVWVKLDGDQIADVSFQGEGCALSTASASLMTTAIKGKSLAEVEQLYGLFHELVTGELGPEVPRERLGKLTVFSGVAEFPSRVKCASMAWHALQSAIKASSRETELKP